MEFKKKLLLIDGHALFHRAYHAIPNMTAPDGFPTGAIFGFLSMLFKALVDIKPTHALVTFDMPGGTYRDKLSGDYKATRKAPDKELLVQLPKLHEILEALDIPIYEKEGYEADDILGIISHKTPKDVLNIIVTGDLDLLQLIDNHTEVYRFKVGFSDIQIFDAEKMVEIYGLHPAQWVDYKAIRGDTSDNIPGVPGIGEKGAAELIKMFGSLDGVYQAAEAGSKKIKAGTLKKLLEGKDKAYLSQKLAHIDQKNHLDFNFEATKIGDYDQTKVKQILHALGIKALDARLPKLSKGAQATLVPEVETASSGSSEPNDLIKTPEQALVVAYLLDPGRREYETSDWDKLAKDIKQNKKLLKIYQEIELPLMPVLRKMCERGIKLDLPWLKALSKKLGQRVEELTKQIHKEAKTDFNIASPIQLREVLFEKLKIPTDNIKKTGKTKALSTGAEQLEKLRGLHPIIELIFEYRELTKLKSTYIDSLPELVGTDGRIHTTYNQTISAHGRLSSVNPNLQNIPIKTELGNEVRKAFIADPGEVLLSLDYSQIELRIAASLSGDPEMMKIFNSGEDFHSATASRIFGVPESEVTPSQRRDAKTINFSILYGVSAFGLSERSDMERGEAAEYIKKYYEAFPQLKAYISGLIQMVHTDGFMTNSLGRIRYFPEVHNSNFAVRSGAERAAVNMPLQSLAADMMKMAILKVDEKYPDLKMMLSVHDELVFEVKKGEEKAWAEKIKPIMEEIYKLKVPVLVEAKAGPNWSEMEKLKI
ncbi:MAG TPA: DNA polymerase [Methylomirabilota bacterium]|nr:DNA polymerase [Methylomirabilota bacterium]